MCGIAGFAGVGLRGAEARERLEAMCAAIQHRGPDSDGFFVADGVGLGMRRLSIIDVQGGRQPIANEDGTVTVVFNGEIYNHHALRRELEAAGHRFRTHSDTEVLVHLYEEHGAEMLPRLHGMFAFSIWDSKRRQLLLGRDRSGMKPLVYRTVHRGIVYASELRALYAFDPSALRVAPGSVMQYLAFGYVPDPRTVFEGVRKLPPAHLLLWREGREPEVRRYWTPPRPTAGSISEGEAVEVIRQKLDAAVSSHLESEVPLGAFLSGGLDSSTVVALMSRHASGRVRTFSIGFAEARYDESAAARAVASAFGTEHTELRVRPDVETLFETVATMFDEPFADSSAIGATFLVAQLARESVTVALSGDGGDELFGGYTRYGDALRRRNGGGRLTALLASVGLMLPHAFPGRNRLVDRGRSRGGRYAATVAQPVRIDEGGVASSAHAEGLVTLDRQLADRWCKDLGDDFAAAMMVLDFETYLPGDILTKVDRTSMAVSLEARAPFLDCDLVDFALTLPGDLRVTASESKRLFRRAIQGIVPEAVLSRPKRGFEVPLRLWFRGPLRHRIEALRTPSKALEPFVEPRAVERPVAEHALGRRDHSALLWRLIVLDYWLAAFARGQLARPPAVPPTAPIGAGRVNTRIDTDPVGCPPPVSQPFLRAAVAGPRLRVGVLVDASGVPSYARSIVRDLLRADFIELALVVVAQVRPDGRDARRGAANVALRAYAAYLESRYRTEPDPLGLVDCSDFFASRPVVGAQVVDFDTAREFVSADLGRIIAAGLDVLLDFGARAARGVAANGAVHGVWRYHFGDSRKYPAGSGFLREIVEHSPLSGIELTRLGTTVAEDSVLMRALFSTVPFLSRKANRFGPIWGARHFVIQSLWNLQRCAGQHPGETRPAAPERAPLRASRRVPGNLEIARWLLDETSRRVLGPLWHKNRAWRWRIGVRRAATPLFRDGSPESLQRFRWLESPLGHYWADPFLFPWRGETWIFFEHVEEARGLGDIACGRLSADGQLVEPRSVLRRGYHLSYPQVFEHEGEIFLLPEAAQSGGLDLYRAKRFPDEWVFERRLLEFRCVDSSPFRAAGAWWIACSPQVVPGNAPITWLFRAEQLEGPWTIHPASPIASDAGVARGAGAIFSFEGRLYRPSQDCSVTYGKALLFNEIMELDASHYAERTIARIDAGWTPGLAGVHTYSRNADWEVIDGGFR